MILDKFFAELIGKETAYGSPIEDKMMRAIIDAPWPFERALVRVMTDTFVYGRGAL